VAFCADAGVIGAPFYLMEYVPGVVLRSRQDTTALTEQQNADLSERLAGLLAAIHGVTGRDISRIGYYVAFGYFKLAVVLAGIFARCLLHQTVGDGFEHEGLAVPTLVARAHQVLDADD
jgi:aminoglycoside phosphotransferase (APT) family kinase protein